MGLKATCCTCLGFFSLLGCLFYITTAIMVLRRNLVFLEHKAGLNQFTMTENELKWKFWEISFTALMMFASMNYCCWRAEVIRKSEDELTQKNEFEKIEEAQIVFDIQKN